MNNLNSPGATSQPQIDSDTYLYHQQTHLNSLEIHTHISAPIFFSPIDNSIPENLEEADLSAATTDWASDLVCTQVRFLKLL